MKKWDIFFIYSPKISLYSNEKYQKITACGIILDDLVFKYKMSETFEPFRRKVKFYDINEVGIEF
ncbi:hypothetical protein [Mesoplasma melaleucae]|uniref:Uncharacterized protein n=1 Tax=Mesoplasma melaleucae TaxID=81459 RepID=A0A2K8NY70_9MOLU|nr:hypothetical protein [Mesoplasma melaleucae]ATZ18128.1 hypothetical protein EMELA_v1c06150 [Mesoplasma melaleucae]